MMAVDGVADLALEGAERLLLGLAFGDLAVEERATFGVGVTDLGHGGHVDGVVEATVASAGEPMRDPAAGGHLDGRGAVVGGELIAVGEPAHVTRVADERARDDRADPKDVGERRVRRRDRDPDPLVGVLELLIETTDIREELAGEVESDMLDRRGRLHVVEERLGVGNVELLGHPAQSQ